MDDRAKVAGTTSASALGVADADGRGGGAEQEHELALSNFTRTYRMRGFTLSAALSDISDLPRRMIATGIHSDTSTSVEFAVAAHVSPAGSGAVGVAMIYVATLRRK